MPHYALVTGARARQAWHTLASLRRDTRFFLAATALYAVGFPGISTVLLGLYILRLGFGLPFLGVMIGSGQLACVLLALPAGWIGRRFGLRRTLFIGLVGTALSAGLLLSVEAAPRALWGSWLIGCWIVLYIPATPYLVNCVPYLMDLAEPGKRSLAFSLMQSLQGFGAFTGSLLAGWMVNLFNSWPGISTEPAAPYRYALFGIVVVIMNCSCSVEFSSLGLHCSCSPTGDARDRHYSWQVKAGGRPIDSVLK
jgi:MFS family permease